MNGFPPSAAEKVAGCKDLLIEIFLRTPAKSLLKFRSVCKRWRSLISHFSAGELSLAHTQFHRQTPAGLLLDDYILPLNPQSDEPLLIFEAPCASVLSILHNQVFQSCNGLLLVAPREQDSSKDISFFVCNPTTHEFKNFPFRPEQTKNMTISKSALAFDPQKSPHYKVICVRDYAPLGAVKDTKIDIYSSKTDSWQILDISFAEPKEWAYMCPVYCNGAVHWYSESLESIYFNVDEETLGTYPMPECLVEDGQIMDYFGESRGRMVMLVGKELDIVVFELAMDYSGWFAKYELRLEPAKTAFPEVIENLEKTYVKVLAVIYEEKEEDSVVVVTAGHVIFSYNLISHELKKLSDCDCETEFKKDDMLPWSAGHPYYASFARL